MNNQSNTIKFDYVVVGAGSSGCVLASRLVRRGLKVLLVEGGTGDPTKYYRSPGQWMEAALRWDDLSEAFVTEEQPGLNNRRIPVSRGRGVGGCSNVNATVYCRGRREDYDSHWPWDVSDVEESFKSVESELFLETRRSNSVFGASCERMLEQAGIPRAPRKGTAAGAGEDKAADAATAPAPSEEYEDPTWTSSGVTSTWQTTTSGGGKSRVTAWASFVKPVMSMPNLTIKDNATVTRLVVEDGRIVGMELMERSRGLNTRGRVRQLRFASASTEVVLCGGVFRTPKILMLSGIGPKQHLEEKKIPVVIDSPQVGLNLHDHLIFGVSFVPTEPISDGAVTEDEIHCHVYAPFALPDVAGDDLIANLGATASSKASKAIDPADKVGSGSSASAISGESSTRGEVAASDMSMGGYMAFGGSFFERNVWAMIMMELMRPGLVMTLLRFLFSLFGWLLVDYTPVRSVFFGRLRAFMTMITTVKSRGTVRLKSADPRAPPLIDPAYLTHPDDVALACGAFRRLRRAMRDTKEGQAMVGTEIAPGLTNKQVERDEDILAFVRNSCQTFHHPVGTCRMGSGVEDSVVSSETMRVHGVKGLRVADASVVPRAPSAPTQAMAMMIGDRAAAIILKDTFSKERMRAAMIDAAGKSIN